MSKQKPIRSRRLERLVLFRLIKAALWAGCNISLYDGEEWVIKRSTDRRALLAASMSTDEDYLRIRTANGVIVGVVVLVYGNEGWDVISDYTDNPTMEAIVTPVMEWAEKLNERTA